MIGKLSNNEYEIKKEIKAKKLELKEFKVPNFITNINAYAFTKDALDELINSLPKEEIKK